MPRPSGAAAAEVAQTQLDGGAGTRGRDDDAPPPRERTLAIVPGASKWPGYPKFQTAPSFLLSLSAVADYLCGPDGLALADDNEHKLINAHKAAGTVMEELHGFLRWRRAEMRDAGAPATALLFYDVGHGLLSSAGVLHSRRAHGGLRKSPRRERFRTVKHRRVRCMPPPQQTQVFLLKFTLK